MIAMRIALLYAMVGVFVSACSSGEDVNYTSGVSHMPEKPRVTLMFDMSNCDTDLLRASVISVFKEHELATVVHGSRVDPEGLVSVLGRAPIADVATSNFNEKWRLDVSFYSNSNLEGIESLARSIRRSLLEKNDCLTLI